MKRVFAFIIFFFLGYSITAQVTLDPKIDKKSSSKVFINKIEITDSYTVFHMQFYDKGSGDDRSVEILRGLEDFGIYVNQQTISFQPTSAIVISDGRRFKFIKAVNIPVSPERKDVKPGQKYFFKVYFEKIPAGFEKIDMIEYPMDSDGSMEYWNFKGINIKNPKNRQPVIESPVQKEILTANDFRLYGKILNAETREPINAKIICRDSKTGEVIDSLQTPRTGKYEFLLNTDDITYEASAPGFENLNEEVNLKFFLKNKKFEKDIYLDPLEATTKEEVQNPIADVAVQDKVKTEEETEETEEEVTIKESENEEANDNEIDDSIGEKLNEEATSFKLDKVYFNLGEATILEDSYTQLNNLAQYLNDHQEFDILIEGHTDNQGDKKLNKKLSLDRAYNVRNYLIAKGINSKRISFKGYGSERPVSPNDTEEHRSKNRRVEYQLIRKDK